MSFKRREQKFKFVRKRECIQTYKLYGIQTGLIVCRQLHLGIVSGLAFAALTVVFLNFSGAHIR